MFDPDSSEGGWDGSSDERGYVLDKPRGAIVVRPSTENDVAPMMAIYTHHITRGLVNSTSKPMQGRRHQAAAQEHAAAEAAASRGERDEVIVGYAYAVPFRKRTACRCAVKHSIYVHPDHLHRGIGRLLLPALVEACAECRRLSPDVRLYRCRQCCVAEPA